MASTSPAPEPVAAAGGLLARRLVVVTGKGGVGKSTVAAALALAAARRGLRTVVAEVHRREDVPHEVLAAGADHVSIDPDEAMEAYLVDQLPVRALADLLLSSRAFTYLAAATPGLRELLTAGRVWELAQPERRTPDAEPYDLVIVDAAASGHGVALLAAPRTFAGAARVGPVARQAGVIDAMLSDPAATAVVAVTTPEELPVNETLALRAELRERLGLHLALVVANATRAPLLDDAQRAALERAPAHPAIGLALADDDRARAQDAQLRRLRAGAGAPVVEAPFRAAGPELETIAGRLEPAL